MFTDKNLDHLRAIFEVYDKSFTPNIAKIYASTLNSFDEESIERGLDLASASSKFLPKPVDIIEAIKKAYKVDDESLELKATAVFEQLIERSNSFCPFVSLVFSDKRACVAFKFIFGDCIGASRVLSDPYQTQVAKKEFTKAYLRIKTLADFDPVIYSADNKTDKNYLVFIGNKEKCERIAQSVFKTYTEIGKDTRIKRIENKTERADDKTFHDMLTSLSNFFGVVNEH